MPAHRNTIEQIIARLSPCPNTGCWFWTGRTTQDGYPEANLDGRRYRQLHRAVYAKLIGPIPIDHEAHHTCEVKLCCNPWHTPPVTKGDHSRHHRHAARWQENKTHCPKGHAYDSYPKRGGRRCLTCHRKWAQTHREELV